VLNFARSVFRTTKFKLQTHVLWPSLEHTAIGLSLLLALDLEKPLNSILKYPPNWHGSKQSKTSFC